MDGLMDVLRHVRLHACVHACMLSRRVRFFGLYLPCGSESEVPGTSPSLCFCLALPESEVLKTQNSPPSIVAGCCPPDTRPREVP